MKNFDSIFAAYVIGWAVYFFFYLSIGKRAADLTGEIERLKNSAGRGR
jgi:predicted secreted protein